MISRISPNTKRILRDLIILLAVTLAMLAATAHGESIRLLDQAAVEGPRVCLREVAELDGAEAQKLAELAVGTLREGDRQTTLTLEAVRESLTKQGVNWGRLSLRGYAACVVVKRTEQAAVVAEAPASVAANPGEAVGLATPMTVRDRAVELIAKLTGVDRSELRIKFAESDSKTLAQSLLSDRFEFEPATSAGIGRVQIVVRRWRGERPVDTQRITAEVSRRYLAVVAARGVSRGQTLAPGDVEVQEVYLDTTRGTPLNDPNNAIGMTAAGLLHKGTVLYPDSLTSPVVVKRGDMVTVRCITGGMVVKIIGRATEEGAVDQVIQVRNERSRDTLSVRVTGPMQGVVVSPEAQRKTGGGA